MFSGSTTHSSVHRESKARATARRQGVLRSIDRAVEKAGNETLHEMIRRHGDRDGDAPAILTPRRPFLSYGRLAAQIESTRAVLNRHRIGRGDRIASVVTTRPEAVVAYVCVAATATVIPLDPKLTAVEMAAALQRSGAKAVIASPGAPAKTGAHVAH